MSEIRNDDQRYAAWLDYFYNEDVGDSFCLNNHEKYTVQELVLVEKGFMAGWFARGMVKAEGGEAR